MCSHESETSTEDVVLGLDSYGESEPNPARFLPPSKLSGFLSGVSHRGHREGHTH